MGWGKYGRIDTTPRTTAMTTFYVLPSGCIEVRQNGQICAALTPDLREVMWGTVAMTAVREARTHRGLLACNGLFRASV